MNDQIHDRSMQTSAETTEAYAALSNDYNPLHVDADFAATTAFGAPVAHGAMALDLLLNALDDTFGPEIAFEMNVRFTAPIKVGERITAGGQANGACFDVWVRKDDGVDVIKGTVTVGQSG